MDTTKMIKAYCLKTKEKNVPMHDAVITKTAKGGYMAGGNDGKGNKMAAIMSETNALKAIADGVATKGFLFNWIFFTQFQSYLKAALEVSSAAFSILCI